ncbi:hypothetical protein [Acidipila rosea]|uniref:Uncharacterized protein n=1 Tax=Acidipila rosea TaxID=768535 RepID=A0A4R1L2C4_9BACT|nr:hypothetical protein [Acidipila rosea]MBW4027925.1 hypothetical protein [Acidobacteriota bacterium]MBW4045298.1 hypothetical protein [Acidobacteriota bacterium]TCK72135.1 hypothetical protein C7378_2768 [Acidipila rosea]
MIESAAQRIEAEVKKVISYLNDEVVPKVRQDSSEGLRVVAGQLRRLADHLEHSQKND